MYFFANLFSTIITTIASLYVFGSTIGVKEPNYRSWVHNIIRRRTLLLAMILYIILYFIHII